MMRESSGCSWPVVAVLILALAHVAEARTAPVTGPFGGVRQDQSSRPEKAAEARVLGVVRDPSGAVVAGSRLEISGLDSAVTRSAVSDWQGRYVFEALPAGRYRLTAEYSGFDTAVRDEVVAGSARDSVVNFVLAVAGQQAVVVVTALATNSPLSVETDPRAPRQPIPAHDGADYLKAIPGFSVVRKGGTDGDPVFRGMAGSRLGVLLDGQQIFGGCGGRMDPPTAYVFPAAYDRIVVLKGPQSVLYGAGMSAGTVLFERDLKVATQPGITMSSALTIGAFGRHDEMADVRAASKNLYLQGGATRSHTGDYRDGNGAAVHSFYTRWSTNAAVGWTPGDKTLVELSAARSDGQAAYADRMMDGYEFARDNVGLKFDRRFASPWLQRVEVQAYYNYIDHVMDNFHLRTPGSSFSVNNPDRATTGGRTAATLAIGNSTSIVAGADLQRNVHTFRNASGKTSAEAALSAYTSALRQQDMRFTQIGLFTEVTHGVARQSRLVAGLRSDWHRALDSRACVATSMCAGRLAAQEQYARCHRSQDTTQRVCALRARLRSERGVGPFFDWGWACRAVPGLLGTAQAGSGHPQECIPVHQAREDDPARCRNGVEVGVVVRICVGLLRLNPGLHPPAVATCTCGSAQRERHDDGERGECRLQRRPEPEGRRDARVRARQQQHGRQTAGAATAG